MKKAAHCLTLSHGLHITSHSTPVPANSPGMSPPLAAEVTDYSRSVALDSPAVKETHLKMENSYLKKFFREKVVCWFTESRILRFLLLFHREALELLFGKLIRSVGRGRRQRQTERERHGERQGERGGERLTDKQTKEGNKPGMNAFGKVVTTRSIR